MHPTSRPVDRLVDPRPTVEGAGVRLQRCIGGRDLDQCDPFLLLDHFGSDDPADYRAGFPMHPHRGIETVTYLLEGEVDHRDTLGNEGRIGGGDVQWMTSGGGIMHEEMPRPGNDGRMRGFQLWVNMPAELKMSRPRYRGVQAADIPIVTRDDGAVIRVIAGEVDGVEGPVRGLYAGPLYADVTVPRGTRTVIGVASGHAAVAYVFEGVARIGVSSDSPGTVVVAPRLAVLGEGDSVGIASVGGDARLLLVAARPLGEPVARYGPFVMNTREEIEQALRDLRDGTFVWQGPRTEPADR
jgi:redox-sensitive bicupin YhaK (pirin superfamily)